MSDTTTDTTYGSGALDGLVDSERYRLLANERRRAVLDVVGNCAGTITLSELAERVVAREAEFPERRPDLQRTVEIRLHHVHLPKMDEMGVLSYDPDENRCRTR